MKSARSYLLLAAVVLMNLIPSFSMGQIIMVNKGDTVSVVGEDFISVIGGVWNDSAGAWYNEGTIYITDTVWNDGYNTMFHDDWEGLVDLRGTDQVIGGQDVTHFWDLELTNSGIKRQAINTVVEDSLILNHLELATDSFVCYVTNPDPGIITRSTGFVSSLDTGALSRNTLDDSTYMFPTGSSLGTLRFRPVELTPNGAGAGRYSVRMANVDATTEGRDISNYDPSLCVVNPLFYHRIKRTSGALPADIEVFFDPAADGVWSTIAHWQNVPWWENIAPPMAYSPFSSYPGLHGLKRNGWTAFTDPGYALAEVVPEVTLNQTDDSLCWGDSVTIFADPGDYLNYTFILNGTDTLQTGPDSSVTVNFLPPGTNEIRVSVSNFHCNFLSDSVVVEQNPELVADAGNDVFICYNEQAVLGGSPTASGGTGPYTYTWDPAALLSPSDGPNPSGVFTVGDTFYVQVDDAFGCTDLDTTILTVNPEIFPDAGEDTSLCHFESYELGGTPTASGGSGGFVYSWTPTIWLNNPVLSNPVSTPDSTTTYFLDVTDVNGCHEYDTVTVTVNYLDSAEISVNGDLIFCDEESTVLTANDGDSWIWSTGETTQSITVTESGDYYVITTQLCGSAVSDAISITVLPKPVADFEADTTLSTINLPINFTDLSIGDITNWDWTFGDGSFSAQQHPTHTYREDDTYTVTLIVTNTDGCKDTLTKLEYIFVDANDGLYIPNGFTPNGDGLNDLFGPVGKAVTFFEMSIFNRWGELIFYSNDLNKHWDGTYRGKPAPEGTYAWKMTFKLAMNNNNRTMGGSVILYR